MKKYIWKVKTILKNLHYFLILFLKNYSCYNIILYSKYIIKYQHIYMKTYNIYRSGGVNFVVLYIHINFVFQLYIVSQMRIDNDIHALIMLLRQ